MESTASIPQQVRVDLQQLEVNLSEDQFALMRIYLDLLLDANQRINLTGIRERDVAWQRHIVDSLTLVTGLEAMEAGAMVVDVGSGGGLPGIPLAIALPDLIFSLMEVTGKKARFLDSCIHDLGLSNVNVIQKRAEDAGRQPPYRQGFEAAVCRALGPLAELLEYTLPLVKVGGLLLAMKGPDPGKELAESSDALDLLGAGEFQVFDAYPETFDNQSVIIRIQKDRPTPLHYPRRPGQPHRAPIGSGRED